MRHKELTGADDLVGRDRELGAVERLLADAREQFAALLLEGDPGIGKTTVFHEALKIAAGGGFHVLSCRAGAAEASMSMAAITDLLEGVPRGRYARLPPAQRRALDVALLRAEPGPGRLDQRAVAAGVRALVGGLAAKRPVLIAVDDVQWVDPASAAVLAFALRRLGGESVGFLATRRVSEESRLDLSSLAPHGELARERLGPLSLGALQRVLRARLGTTFPHWTLVRLHAAANGNPLFAIEIGRVLSEREPASSAEPLPVPDDLRELVRRRVDALPKATRDVLLGAALLAHPTVVTLDRAFGATVERDLEPAARAGIARITESRVAFAHPLHSAAFVASASAAERQRVHLRLADVTETVEEGARHLGLGTARPDAAVAAVLEEGAAAALARGGLHSAAELVERARTLTPAGAGEAADDRGIRAAELHIHAGNRDRAGELLHELLDERLTAEQRAEVFRLDAELHLAAGEVGEARRLLLEALPYAHESRPAARILLELVFIKTLEFDFEGAVPFGRRAVAALEGADDDALVAEALAYTAMAEYLAGRGVDLRVVERVTSLEEPERMGLPGLPAGAVAALLLAYVGRHAEARQRLDATLASMRERGDEGDLPHLLKWLSWLEMRRARFADALKLADEAVTSGELTGNRSFAQFGRVQRALTLAHVGDLAEARGICAEALEQPDRSSVAQIGLWIQTTLTHSAMSEGDAATAWRHCAPVMQAVEALDRYEPVVFMFVPDGVEALVGLGELDRAEAVLLAFERNGRRLDRTWALATGKRCRALLLAARGDLDGSGTALDEALSEHDRLDMPFERARTLLVKGQIARRARRRRLATEAVAEAVAEFERMGAKLWAARARDELTRLAGARVRNSNELTTSERRVVELAAQGLANKEIASRLVVSVHTVEVHLSHAFAKLGVRSRSQLAARLASITSSSPD